MIYGKRVRFRLPECQADHEKMVAWRNDPAIKPYFYNDEPVSLENHLKWWAKVSQDLSQRNYIIDVPLDDMDDPTNPAMIDKNCRVPVGMTSIMNIDFTNRTGEYARFKIDPCFHGQGIAYDAEMTLLHHAFTRLNLNKIWLHAFNNNEAVINLHYKTGFKVEGTLRKHVFKDGEYRDIICMAILADEFFSTSKQAVGKWEPHYNLGP